MINLTSYSSVQSNLFVRLEIEEYRTSPSGAYTSQVLRFSDRLGNHDIEGETYIGLGNLMGVTAVNSELRVSGNEMTVSLSGIPNTSIAEVLYSKIKGSNIKIWRALFNASTGEFLNIADNPVGRFQGFVNNFALTEEFDVENRSSSNTLVLTCSSVVDVLANKIAGRRTNPSSQNRFFPNDRSMDRVPTIENAYFDFGVK